MPLPRSFSPFGHRAYALLWTGAFVSNIGTWMESIAVGILITEATHSSLWLSLVMAAGFVPTAFLGPVGGALADRHERRTIILTTTAVQTVFAGMLTFLAVIGDARPGLVLVIMFGAGCAAAIGFPTYMSILPDLVPVEDLPAAVALSAAQWNLGRVIGPALAGIVIAFGGYAWAFGINTLSFFAVIAVVVPLVLPPPAPHDGTSIRESMRAGFRFARREPGIRAAITLMVVNSLLAAPFIALVSKMALDVLGGGTAGVAVLVTAQGVGAVLMAFSLGSLVHRFGLRRVLLFVLAVLPIALVLYAAAPTVPASALAIFAVGFLYLGALSSFTTVAQLRAPSQVRGRTLSVFTVILGTMYPLGLIVQGAIATVTGLRVTTAGAGVLMAVALVGMRIAWPRFADALDEPVVHAP
ncbi:MAG: MFS transporter [Acidimicrobiia bacterium]